jgi:hypothetical protein
VRVALRPHRGDGVEQERPAPFGVTGDDDGHVVEHGKILGQIKL